MWMLEGIGEDNLIQIELSAETAKRYTTILGSVANRFVNEYNALKARLNKENIIMPKASVTVNNQLKANGYVFYWGLETYVGSTDKQSPVDAAEEIMRNYYKVLGNFAVDGSVTVSTVSTAALRALQDARLSEATDLFALAYFFSWMVPWPQAVAIQVYSLLNTGIARAHAFQGKDADRWVIRALTLVQNYPDAFPKNMKTLVLLYLGNIKLALSDGKQALSLFMDAYNAAGEARMVSYRNVACCSLMEVALAMSDLDLARKMVYELSQTEYPIVKADTMLFMQLQNCMIELKEKPKAVDEIVARNSAMFRSVTKICNEIRRQETKFGVLLDCSLLGASLHCETIEPLKPFEETELNNDYAQRIQENEDVDFQKKQINISGTADIAAYAPLSTAMDDRNYVFISYSHRDFRPVLCDLLELRREGVRFWYDKDLTAGESWKDEIEEKLCAPMCAGVIFFFSENSLRSDAVFHEVKYALERSKNQTGSITNNYFMVNLTDSLPSSVIGKLMKQGELTAEKGKLYLEAFLDDQTYIPRDANPLSTRHLKGANGMLGQIRNKFNVMD